MLHRGTRICNTCNLGVWGSVRHVGWLCYQVAKCTSVFHDIVALFEYVLDRLSTAELETFLVQAWFIWNQRNAIIHGRQMRDPKWLNQRAMEYLDEYRNVQAQMSLPNVATQSRQS